MCIQLFDLTLAVLQCLALSSTGPSETLTQSAPYLSTPSLLTTRLTPDIAIKDSPSDDTSDGKVPDAEMPMVGGTRLSNLLLQTQGRLEHGDHVTFQDGSFYDEYSLDGRAGQPLLITLESDDFDAFLVLLNAQGDIIAQNDDVSPDNANATLAVVLPENNIYLVVASGFQQHSRGKYRLTVWSTAPTEPEATD